MPAFGFAARECRVLLLRAGRIARRVARPAVSESLDEIRAAIPLRVVAGIGPIDAGLQVARFPEAEERARNRHRVPAVLLLHGLARHDEGVERRDILVRRLREMVIRKSGIEMTPAPIDAFAHRA